MKLKPCPFCGGDAKEKGMWIWNYRIECRNCGASTARNIENDGEATAWNRRVKEKKNVKTKKG